MPQRKYNLGLVGCGHISLKHITAIANTQNLSLAALCDSNKSRLTKLAGQQKVKAYSNFAKLLADPDIDIISICTPSGLHPKMIIQAAKAGKHVVCEKPLALSISQAKAAISACHSNSVKLFVVKQNRHMPAILALKKALDDKAFGKLIAVNISVLWDRPKQYFQQDAWRGSISKDGGLLLNQANHHIDLLRWFFGKPLSVFALSNNISQKAQTEEYLSAMIKYKSNFIANFQASITTYPSNLQDSITIIGQKGTVKIDSVVGNLVSRWQFENYSVKRSHLTRKIKRAQSTPAYGHTMFYRHVTKQLANKNSLSSNGADELGTLKLILALYKSSKLSKPVKL